MDWQESAFSGSLSQSLPQKGPRHGPEFAHDPDPCPAEEPFEAFEFPIPSVRPFLEIREEPKIRPFHAGRDDGEKGKNAECRNLLYKFGIYY